VPKFSNFSWLIALALPSGACSSTLAPPNGACALDQSVSCGVSLDGGVSNDVGLNGYSCTGAARPDDNPHYIEGVPQGIVCADRGLVQGKQTYCCSSNLATCAYDPITSCDPGTWGFECRGSSRPEALNAAIACGNGVYRGDYIDYCCSGQDQPTGCTQISSGCSDRLTGFTCPGSVLPRGEDLGASESRADYYRPLCSMPKQAANVTYNSYCCYMPALPPEGGSCVQDTVVPGCAPGRFGFACYGTENPHDDFSPMQCPDKGV
jgi:hypothetical protein